MLADLFNTFKPEYDVSTRLHKSNALLYLFVMLLIIPYIGFIQELESASYKIICAIVGLYAFSIAKYVLDTTDKALSEISRKEDEINRLKKEVDQIKST